MQSLAVQLPQSRGIYIHNIMAGYDKFRNHMEEPDTFIDRMNKMADDMKEEDKDLIVNVATAGLIGVAAVTAGPAMAVLGGALWAADKIRRS